MSSRQLRKAQQQREQQQLGGEEPLEEEVEEEAEEEDKPFNPFALLSDEDGGAAGGDQEEEEEEEEEQRERAGMDAPEAAAAPAPRQQQASSKKKKKGKKGKGGGKEEDEIDEVLKQLRLSDAAGEGGQAGAAQSTAPAAARPKSQEVLCVDTRALRGDDELRRIFGASVIASVDREEAAESNRRRGRYPQRNSAVARRIMRKGLLVSPKDHWPLLDTGAMSMQSNGWKDGVQHFQYVWSQGYRITQKAFEQCQATYDPNAIAALLQQAPYHVDSLLTMYDLYRHLGENQFAEETLARALYALEMAWHPAFDIRTANCRLDYQVPENRALFVTLFRHVQALSRAGCHRTALECCKLLLALDPQDPLGATCLIDYLAIRAENYEYVKAFAMHFNGSGDLSLSIRPNFAFSLSLSKLRREQQAQARQAQQQQQAAAAEARAAAAARRGSGAKAGPAASSSKGAEAGSGKGGASSSGMQGAKSGGEEGVQEQSALQLMVAAVLLHPSVVPRLHSKLQEKGAGREPRWSQVLLRRLYTQPHDAASATLQHLGAIFVERSHLLWKAPDALELLYQGAAAAADLAENKETEATARVGDLALTAEDWKCVRQESFPDSRTNEYRHYRLADFSDNVQALPREELDAAMGAPGQAGIPADHPNQQEMLEQLQEQLVAAQQFEQQHRGTNMTEEQLHAANPLTMFLRSLLPWVNAGQQPDYAAEGAPHDSEEEGRQ